MNNAHQSIGPFEIRGMLGRGAMAVVWLGYDPSLDREVAIKEPLLPPASSDDLRLEYGRRFVREARAAARLNHPGIVTVHYAAVYDERPIIVMELIRGATLRDILKHGKLSTAQTSAIMEELLHAVAFAHEHGVTHRDLKPDNVFVTRDGAVKLADFGIAQFGDVGPEGSVEGTQGRALTREGTMLGTPAYMSPERIRGEKVDARCDVFALGVIAYECVSGANPFGSESSTHYATIIHRIINEPIPPLSLQDDVAGPLTDVVMKSLAKQPGDRYADADAMLDAWRSAAPAHGAARAELAALCAATAGESHANGGATPVRTQMWGPAVAQASTPVTNVAGSDDDWHNSDVTLEFKAGGTEGLARAQYRLDDGPWTEGHAVVVPAPPGGANDGVHRVAFRSADSTGLVETARTTQVRIDTCAPTTVAIGADDAWHNEDVTLRFSASDAQSGVAVTEHRLDDGPWLEGSSVIVPVAGGASASGERVVSYRSRDVAGNVEETRQVRVRIDASPPLTAVSGADDAWHATDIVLRFSANDQHSGVAGTAHRVDEGPWTEGNAAVIPARPDGANDGAHTVAYRSRDNAGNLEPVQTVVARIDTVPPVTSVKGADEVRRDGRVTLRFSARDAHSDIAYTEYRIDGGPWTKGTSAVVPGKPAGVHAVAFRSADAAGNLEAERVLRLETGPGATGARKPAAPSKAQRRRRGLMLAGVVAALAVAIVVAVVVARPLDGGGGPSPTPTQSTGPDPAMLAAQAGTLSQLGTDLQEQYDLYAKVVGDIKSKADRNKQAVKDWNDAHKDLDVWEAEKRAADKYNDSLPAPTPAHTELRETTAPDPDTGTMLPTTYPTVIPGSTPTPKTVRPKPAAPSRVELSLEDERQRLASIAADLDSVRTSLTEMPVDPQLTEPADTLANALDLTIRRVTDTREALRGAIDTAEAGEKFNRDRLARISAEDIQVAITKAQDALATTLSALGLASSPAPATSPTPALSATPSS